MLTAPALSPPLRLLVRDLARADGAISAYHDRVDTPSRVLRRVRRILPLVGITRLGLCTGLDLVGMPVAFATRPNSFSLSVNQGKGIDVDSAMVSAAMEATEVAIAERRPRTLERASFRAMSEAGRVDFDPALIARCRPEQIDPEEPLDWAPAYDLSAGRPMVVPWRLVGIDHRIGEGAGAVFEQSSDGLASGSSPSEAVFHGLLELIERDGWALMQFWNDAKIATRTTDPRAFGDPVLDVLVGRIEAAGLKLVLLDLTSDLGVPIFFAVIVPGDLPKSLEVRWAQICGGCGCHVQPVRAVLRAVTEAAQSRLTYIAGGRDDITPRQYARLDEEREAAMSLHALAARPAGPPRGGWGEVRGSIQDGIRHLVGLLARHGMGQVVVAPIRARRRGVNVVRVIVPGLEIGLDGACLQIGTRAVKEMLEATE